jgi:hypothetical protein
MFQISKRYWDRIGGPKMSQDTKRAYVERDRRNNDGVQGDFCAGEIAWEAKWAAAEVSALASQNATLDATPAQSPL